MVGLMDVFGMISGGSDGKDNKSGASLGGLEGLVANHPRIAALVGTLLLRQTEDHGLLRNIADYWTLSDLFQGKAGTLEKAYLAFDAGEGAAGLAGKAGATGLTKFFAGAAGFVASMFGEGKLETDIRRPKTAPQMAPG